MKGYIKQLYIKILRCLPLQKDKIVFCNFVGKGYGGNPKYIAEEIVKQNWNLKMIWLAKKEYKDFPPYVKTTKIWGLGHYYHLATAKYIVSNVRGYLGIEKRNEQIYLQTWHGPFSPKLIEADAGDKLTKQYIIDAKHDGRIADGILANSALLEKQYRRAFWLNSNVEILRFGLPRNDSLINNENNIELKKEIRNRIGVNEDDYLVLYAPTFRDDYSLDGYKLDFENIRLAFERMSKKQSKILIRLHPNAQKQSDFISYSEHLVNVTKYPDMQELAIVCDAIISDYSSTPFDFAILHKPAFLCTLDLEHYLATRGLLDDYFSFPFPKAETSTELINMIDNFDRNKYLAALDTYFANYPIYDKGTAAKQTVEWLKQKGD